MSYLQPVVASKLQAPLSIQKAIRLYIASSLPSDTEYTLKLSQIDNRLKLPLCPKALEIFTHSQSIKPGRNSIGVRCNYTQKWTIYTTAIINIYKDVIILSQPIRRGEIFHASILKTEKREISTLRSGFITDPVLITYKQATRNLRLGTVINKSNLTEPKLIKRGDHVTITAGFSNLQISVTGIAMMNGIKNQNIKVKNLKSQQIIQATVIKKGLVAVML